MNIDEEFVDWELTKLLPKICYFRSRLEHIAWIQEDPTKPHIVEYINRNNICYLTPIRDAWNYKEAKKYVMEKGYRVICSTDNRQEVFNYKVKNLHTKEVFTIGVSNDYRTARRNAYKYVLTNLSINGATTI